MIKPQTADKFWKLHLLWPMAGFCLLAIFLEFSGTDIWLADEIYHFSGNTWLFRNAWITETLIHKDGRILISLFAIGLLMMIVSSFILKPLSSYRKGLIYLLLSVLLSGVLINILKHLTHVDCPWDLLRYGGDYPYIRNFSWQSEAQVHGACFPAGHASAGWAWIGLYYFAHEYAKPWRFAAFIGVLLTGLIFGIGQELRGAHFISHDVWTLGLCWLFASMLYWLFFSRSVNTQDALLAVSASR